MLVFECVYIICVAFFPSFHCEQNDLIEERASVNRLVIGLCIFKLSTISTKMAYKKVWTSRKHKNLCVYLDRRKILPSLRHSQLAKTC